MGHKLCLAKLKGKNGTKLLVTTSHLESSCPTSPTWNQMFRLERVFQAKEAMVFLNDSPNVIFGGDMNWKDELDGPPPLPLGRFDAWQQLHASQVYKLSHITNSIVSMTYYDALVSFVLHFPHVHASCVRYVTTLWALPTPQTILAVESNWESHLSFIWLTIAKNYEFQNACRDATVIRGQSEHWFSL